MIEREDAYRHVDVEDPAPAPVIGDRAAQHRPEDRGEAEDGDEESLPLAALGRREDVADDRLRDRHQGTGAKTLQGAVGDQLGHVLAGARKRRADQEDDHAAEEEDAATVDVGELAVDRHGNRRGEQVGGDNPGIVLAAAAQVTDDLWQGGRDDGLVERREQHAEHQSGDQRHESRGADSLANSSRRRDLIGTVSGKSICHNTLSLSVQ